MNAYVFAWKNYGFIYQNTIQPVIQRAATTVMDINNFGEAMMDISNSLTLKFCFAGAIQPSQHPTAPMLDFASV